LTNSLCRIQNKTFGESRLKIYLPSYSEAPYDRVTREDMGIYYYVYVLRSEKDGKFYVGYTNNVRKRLEQHNSG
jgi:hypothetical protein